MALSVAPWGPAATFDFAGPAGDLAPAPSWDAAEAAATVDDMVGVGGAIVGGLRERWPDLICGSSVHRNVYDVAIATTSGFDGALRGTSYGCGATVQASREGDMFQWAAEHYGLPSPDAIDAFLADCHRWIDLGLRVADIEPGAYPVVLAPNSLALLLRVLEAGVKGDAIHEGKSPLTGRQGQPVLSPRFTLVDDPTWGRTGKTVPFDDEGVPTRRRDVFAAGVFEGPLTDREYAAKLGVEPTGHGFREQFIYRNRVLAAGVSIGPGNWRIAAPSDGPSLDDLLADVSCGVYVDCSYDCWMGTVINGDFTGTLHQAYKIENGRLVGRLKHRSFSGNIYRALGDDLLALGRDVDRPRLGFDTIEAPHLLIRELTIS